VGETSLSWKIRRDIDLMQAEAEQRGERLGNTWIEKLDLAVQPPGALTRTTADPVGELRQLMRDDVLARSGFRDEIRELVRDLLADLPPESRHFAGDDEAGFDRFVDDLLVRGAEDITARMSAADRDDT